MFLWPVILALSHAGVPAAAHAATVWTGPRTSFAKAGFADPTQASNQDRLTPNVWLTRGDTRGLYNARTEVGYTHLVSPADTEWAYGTTTKLRPVRAQAKNSPYGLNYKQVKRLDGCS